MEEYLRSVQGRLAIDALEDHVHAVLGGPEPDVDTVAATLCMALHLSQKETSDRVCVPVLCRRRRGAALPGDTVRYLQRLKISESLLLWKDDVDLVKLHHTGKFSLTLLRDGLLDSSECHALESSILRVVHHDGQQHAGDDGAMSAVTTVSGEILQQAAEHIGAALGETLGEALWLQSEALWTKHGRRSATLEDLMRSVQQRSDVTAGRHQEATLQDLEQLLTLELKEFSDGEMTIALTSLTTDKEDRHCYASGLKSFSQRHGYDGVVVLLSIEDTVHQPHQQVAVYSNNTDLLNQICCELEENSSWSLSGELESGATGLQVYHIPINTDLNLGTPPSLREEILGLLKDFVDRRSSVLACHPSSRTSSTEGVAGSVEFSQGSSGINDMDGSDIERTEGASGDVVPTARVMADGEENTGGVGVGGDLVSPDSGMTTIRSSRSSKESSVFLSDDSPVGEVIAGGGPAAGPGGPFLRNPSPLGLLSLSPPVPPERRKNRSSRNKSENFDLFSFDPLHSSDHSMPRRGEITNSGVRPNESVGRAGSSSLSELEELSLLDFSNPNSMGGFDSRHSSIDHHAQMHEIDMIETVVPPTPVNSVVGSRPPSSCGVRFFPEDVVERINGLQHKDSVSSSLSESWDELGFDTQGALSSSDHNIWNRTKESESPLNIMEEVRGKEERVDDGTVCGVREDVLKSENAHQRGKNLEPQLSLITEQFEYDTWNPESVCKDQWNPVTLNYLQLTPPEEGVSGKCRAGVIGVKEKSSFREKVILNTLTPDTSKEEDEGGKKGDMPTEQLDFWTYTAQKGLLKPESSTTPSYPESLDMWNTTIREDSLSPLTTPDNTSGNRNIEAGTSVESPLGFSDGGMVMWNTTIQEDSSSTITSPEGPENEKDLSHTGSPDASDSPEVHARKPVEEKAIEEDSCITKVLNQTPEDLGCSSYEHNVKIVVEAVDGRTQSEDSCDNEIQSFQSQQSVLQNLASGHSENETSPYQGSDMWDLPVPGMVTSTSEYDNIGAGTWSTASSPEAFASPVVDMIQLEEQSSPFVAVTKPFQIDDSHTKYQEADDLRLTEYQAVILDKEQPTSQMFLFEGTSDLGHMASSGLSSTKSDYGGEESDETDWIEQTSGHSPFVMMDYSTVTQTTLADHYSSPGDVAETQIPASLSPSLESQGGPDSDSIGNVMGKKPETMFLSSSSGGDKDTQKYSPDSLHAGSRDELRSNSDGDSSSGLEMDYIIVSGTVKEAEREWRDRPKPGTRKSMETFSMLSYAATVLQSQAQAANKERQENIEQDRTNQTITYTGSTKVMAQSQANCETFNQPDSRPTGCSQTHVEEGNDDKSSIVTRSVSPSLRYPSDHFLKTREEVYVHSQISMEDSDEGGQSPPAPPPCPTSLGDFQVWKGQDAPQTSSEPQSPVLTNSSMSHNSSMVGTPISEPGVSTDIGLGLPFSGDLMEEENDEEEHEEEIDVECAAKSKWTSEVKGERGGRQQLASTDLLSFTEELIGGSSFQQKDLQTLEPKRDQFLQSAGDYYNGQPLRTGDGEKWSTEQQIGNHESSQDSYSPVLRHQEVTQQFSSHPTDQTAAYQWTGSETVTQGQTQYGYNYHHIDQRTENQSSHPACVHTKPNNQPNITDVYAEFTTDATATQYGCEQAESYYEPGGNAEYRLDDQGSKYQYAAERQHGHDSTSMCPPEPQCSPYQADSQSQYESDHAHYQIYSQPSYQSHVQPEREDHGRYVPEGYVHFLLSRHSQQGDGAAGMMRNVTSSEEAAEEGDNREDPPSSADLSAESNQRRKLAAPPMNVSLDRSEGSLLSEDALDTEDEALDTGDDLDVNIDELDTPDEADSPELNQYDESEECNLGAAAASSDAIAGHGAAEENRQSRLWRSVVIGEQEHRIDMKCIEPYKRVISHGGYYAEQNAIIVFAACFLPDSDCDNYTYVMENLFLYVISTLELMVAEDYMIVYLNGATPRRRMPGFSWMKKCYQMIDRRLKKNLKLFIIVHPSWFIRTLLGITRPFISTKFSSKIKYVHSLQELEEIIPMEFVHIPPSIIKADKKGNSLV